MNHTLVPLPTRQSSAEALSGLLQRKCDCGSPTTSNEEKCDRCQAGEAIGLQAKLTIGASDDPLEQEADRAAAHVMKGNERLDSTTLASAPQISRRANGNTAGQSAPDSVSSILQSTGSPLPADTRAFFEPRFGHDFSRVRIHRDTDAASSAREVAAHAYTVGHHVVFASGRFAPETAAGKHLLAHELAHVVQQHGTRPLIQRGDDEATRKQQDAERARAKTRLESWAAGKTPTPSTDPTDRDFAFTAQELALEITHQPAPDNFKLLDKPTGKAKLANWTTAFRDAYQLGLLILDSKGTDQRETRAAFIGVDLATVGFVTEAMHIASKLPDANKEHIYKEVAKSPETASLDQIKTLSRFFTAQAASPRDHAFLTSLTDKSGAFAQKTGTKKLLAILEPTLAKYRKSDDYRDVLAEILVFDPSSRVPVSDWLWTTDKDYLFELLNSSVFVEPGYGVAQFMSADGTARELTMEGDLPWVYTYKQKFYTDYLVKLGSKHAVEIKKPTKLEFTEIKAWLDSETENIGTALAAEHPNAPDKITEAYQHIADIFFFHVDRGNVTPNRAGKLAHLGAGAPSKMRLKSDCDVLATYATRLLRSSGFTPVGYLVVEPDTGSSHAVALLKKALPGSAPIKDEPARAGPDRYYIVNNKEVSPNDATSKESAIRAAKDDSLGVYDPEPDAFKIYYEDAATNGAMSEALWKTDEKTHRKDLDKVAPVPATIP